MKLFTSLLNIVNSRWSNLFSMAATTATNFFIWRGIGTWHRKWHPLTSMASSVSRAARTRGSRVGRTLVLYESRFYYMTLTPFLITPIFNITVCKQCLFHNRQTRARRLRHVSKRRTASASRQGTRLARHRLQDTGHFRHERIVHRITDLIHNCKVQHFL